MNAYKYDSQTGEFVHEGLCQESPREPGQFLIPANATTVSPPEEQAGKARVWDGSAWGYVTDNRGKTMYSVDDSRQTSVMSNVLGEDVPEGWTLTPPPDADNKYTFVGGQWVEQSVEETGRNALEQLQNLPAHLRRPGGPDAGEHLRGWRKRKGRSGAAMGSRAVGAVLHGERPARCGGDAGGAAGGGHQHRLAHPAPVHDPRT